MSDIVIAYEREHVPIGTPFIGEVIGSSIGVQRHIGKRVIRENRSQSFPNQRFCDGTDGADLKDRPGIMSGIEYFSGGNAGYQVTGRNTEKAGDFLPVFLCPFRCLSVAIWPGLKSADTSGDIFFLSGVCRKGRYIVYLFRKNTFCLRMKTYLSRSIRMHIVHLYRIPAPVVGKKSAR